MTFETEFATLEYSLKSKLALLYYKKSMKKFGRPDNSTTFVSTIQILRQNSPQQQIIKSFFSFCTS
jgi:hypothetical protein